MLHEGKAFPPRRDHQRRETDLPAVADSDAIFLAHIDQGLLQGNLHPAYSQIPHQLPGEADPSVGAEVGLANFDKLDTQLLCPAGVDPDVVLREDLGLQARSDGLEVSGRLLLIPAVGWETDRVCEVHLAVVAEPAGARARAVNEEDGHAGALLGKGECRAQPCRSCADDDAVEIVCHVLRFRAEHTWRVGLAQQAGPRVHSSTKNLTE